MKQQKKLSVVFYYLLGAFIIMCNSCATRSTVDSSEVYLKGPVVSCGHLTIYQVSEDNKSYIQIIIDTEKIELDRENIWTIPSDNAYVTVRLRKFEEEIVSRLCNDVNVRRNKPAIALLATLGTLTLSMTEAEWINYKKGKRYKVDLKSPGMKFDDESTYGLNISQATVGWLPG
ncbi:MAG: hypothetical protein ABJF04_20555 [Reichenbachiella sp.]|uniref:hypothetical protein n=1 Tax=Reichenbachiella sp. TaxID=2184521 RepID=UPI0032663108